MSSLIKSMPYGWAAAGARNKWYKPPRKKLCKIHGCAKVRATTSLCSKHKEWPVDKIERYLD